MINTDVGVVRFVCPWVYVFRPVQENHENVALGKPSDEVIQEVLGGLVDPVKILHDQQYRPLLALADEDVSQGLERPLFFLLGIQLEVILIIYLEG